MWEVPLLADQNKTIIPEESFCTLCFILLLLRTLTKNLRYQERQLEKRIAGCFFLECLVLSRINSSDKWNLCLLNIIRKHGEFTKNNAFMNLIFLI